MRVYFEGKRILPYVGTKKKGGDSMIASRKREKGTQSCQGRKTPMTLRGERKGHFIIDHRKGNIEPPPSIEVRLYSKCRKEETSAKGNKWSQEILLEGGQSSIK